MSVLETFFFEFAADPSKLKEGLKGARKDSDDLGGKLGEVDKSASKLGENFSKLAKAAGGALATLFALHEVKKLTQETADHTFEVYQQAKAMGVAVETLSAWQHAVVASGGSAEGATKSMGGLRDRFVEMSRFGGMMGADAFMFEKLGLSAKDMHDSIKDPMIAMQKLAGTFGALNSTQQLYLGKKLGLDIGTISLLSQGRRGLDEMIERQKQLGVVTEQQALAAAKFKMQQAELGQVFETVSREITSALLPAWTWLMRGIESAITFLREHKTFAIAFFGGIAAVISAAYLPAMVSAAITTLAATWPFLLIAAVIGAAIAVIAIIIEDIEAFRHGQNSLIGDIVKKWPIVGEIFRAVGEIVGMVLELMKMQLKGLVFMIWDGPIAVFKYMSEAIPHFLDLIVKKFPILGTAASAMRDVVTGAITPIIDVFEWLWEKIKKVFDLVKDAPKAVLNWIGHNLARATGGKYDDITGEEKPVPEPAKKATETSIAATLATNPGVAKSAAQAAAEASEKKYGIPAAVTMAQYALESGNGKHMPTGSNNPFGIKATAAEIARGQFVEAMTTEHLNGVDVRVMQKFKKFDSLDDAFDQHAKLLATGAAYRTARMHTDDPRAFADALTGKYATDPNYGTKLKALMAGQQQLATVSANPVNTMNSNTIANSTSRSAGDTHVSVGPVAVHTQASDPQAVSKALAEQTAGHYKNALEQYDDGMAI